MIKFISNYLEFCAVVTFIVWLATVVA